MTKTALQRIKVVAHPFGYNGSILRCEPSLRVPLVQPLNCPHGRGDFLRVVGIEKASRKLDKRDGLLYSYICPCHAEVLV